MTFSINFYFAVKVRTSFGILFLSLILEKSQHWSLSAIRPIPSKLPIFSGGLCDWCHQRFKLKVTAIVFVVIVVIVVIHLLFLVRAVELNEYICRSSNFTSLAIHGQSGIMYGFVSRSQYRLHDFSGAKKACEDLGATLWEVLGGKEEWDAVIEMAKREGKKNLWLNGKATLSRCSGDFSRFCSRRGHRVPGPHPDPLFRLRQERYYPLALMINKILNRPRSDILG
jgi:hypothetical protein